MTRFIIIRVIQAFFALIGIITLVFFLVRLSGNPAELLKNPNMTPAAYEQLMERLGLNKSYWEQYKIYMTDLAHGNLGQSLLKFRPVSEMIGNALPNTLKLAIPSFTIGLLLAVFLGVLAATRRDGFLDNGVKFLAFLGQALPGFWVAIMAVLLLSVYWELLASQGMAGPANYVLPVGPLIFMLLPGLVRLVRCTLLAALARE